MLGGLAAHRRLRLPFSRRSGGRRGLGALTASSVWDALQTIATGGEATVRTEVENLTVAGADLGSGYTWARVSHETEYVIDSEAAWDALLGAGDDDARPALVYIDAPLVTVTHDPARRRPFIAIAGPGELALGADVNIYGANHSASGSDLDAARILWRIGTFDGVTDPEVPAAGGAGAPGVLGAASGETGSAGTGGGTGGGGSGLSYQSGGTTGDGAAGTSFTGGSASGGRRHLDGVGEHAEDRGGAGGSGNGSGSTSVTGGAGNPAGASDATANVSDSRTGGVGYLAFASVTGAGSLVADGGGAAYADHGSGGGSGGGSVLLQTDDASGHTGSVTANGGAGNGSAGGNISGNGGLGTARTLPLTEDV